LLRRWGVADHPAAGGAGRPRAAASRARCTQPAASFDAPLALRVREHIQMVLGSIPSGQKLGSLGLC